MSLPLFTRQSCFSLLGSGFFQERHSKKPKPMTIGAMTSNHHISVNSDYIVTTILRRWRSCTEDPTRPLRSGARAVICPA